LLKKFKFKFLAPTWADHVRVVISQGRNV